MSRIKLEKQKRKRNKITIRLDDYELQQVELRLEEQRRIYPPQPLAKVLRLAILKYYDIETSNLQRYLDERSSQK